MHTNTRACTPANTNFLIQYNNNDYLERLTRSGPKRLHVLYKYILSKFNAYNMKAHTHTHAHTQTHTRTRRRTRARSHTHTHARAHTHTHQLHIRAIRAMRLKKVFKKRKVFKEDLKELTEVEWRTETGSWFQITGAW